MGRPADTFEEGLGMGKPPAGGIPFGTRRAWAGFDFSGSRHPFAQRGWVMQGVMEREPEQVDANAPAARPAIRLENLSKTYPGNAQRAVDSLSIDIADGEVFTLLGPSGCGKSTTLRLVAGLEEPDEGTITFAGKTIVSVADGISLPPDKRNLGMVFQSYAIWPHMTVEENVGFPLKARKFPLHGIKDRVAEVLDLVGMAGMEKRPGPLLSGGQQQRVALARALVTEPGILLLDERPAFFCWTSRSPILTPSCANRCGSRSSCCRSASTSPCCSSPTTRWRRSACPTALH
jgi:ABC-type ATPase involved in cell division